MDLTPRQLLRWHLDAGADEAIGERPIDRYAASREAEAPPPAPPAASPAPA
ncbi:MAG: uracil-DNA glycosylase, partial [Proteobacteria bacterium]|nr:uracil-DNA glycosylase [Pseudomonadota bacterium]